MPKLAPFALGDLRPPTPASHRAVQLLVFFLLFGLPYFAAHISLLGLPYFWDELGQFVPTALDLLRDHTWVAHSTLPNIHPPGVEAYLVLWYKLFGYSIVITRVAMLVVAAFGALGTFLLSVELCRGAKGAPAFYPVIMLLASPLFFTQSMMAQLDMPAMVFTVWALYFFLRKSFVASAVSCVGLVLSKETGIIVPLIFLVVLARRSWRRRRKNEEPASTPRGQDPKKRTGRGSRHQTKEELGGLGRDPQVRCARVPQKRTGRGSRHQTKEELGGLGRDPRVRCARVPQKSLSLFLIAPAVLALWLVVLHNATGHWAGNPDFAHYNISYSLHPVRIVITLARRFFYIFIAEFRWIGSLALLMAVPRLHLLVSRPWRVTLYVFAGHFLLMSLLGGAALERYVLPILPIFYIAVAIALSTYSGWFELLATAAMVAGLVFSLFWNPPYPFPFENNLAMVDFVRLQESASAYAERNLPASRIATAWPYTGGFSSPDSGFVEHSLQVIETNDLHRPSIAAVPPQNFDVLITYTRTWAPPDGVVSNAFVRKFLTKFYEYAPDITEEECARLGLTPIVSWTRRGQTTTLFKRTSIPARAMAPPDPPPLAPAK